MIQGTQDVSRWQSFYASLERNARFFVFILLVLCIYRIAFLWVFRAQLEPETSVGELALTLFYGLRLSLKSAAALTAIPFIACTLMSLVVPRWEMRKFHLVYGLVCIALLSLLYQVRIPYYLEFSNTFDLFLFNTFNDDFGAIVQTAIIQHHGLTRLLYALLSTVVLGFLYVKLLARPLALRMPRPDRRAARWAIGIMTGLGLCLTAWFLRFGGSFTYTDGIYWKNAARMQQHLLNEAIFDDVQALYRARKMSEYFDTGKSREADLDPARVRAALKALGLPEVGEDLDAAFKKTVRSKGNHKPRHVFVIVGETYMLWPMLDAYAGLGAAEGVKRVIAHKDSAFTPYFLPGSIGTMSSVVSIVLGMPDMNLYPSFQASTRQAYATSMPLQMKRLGYQTHFFYGGFQSWENVNSFVLTQGFEHSWFYGTKDYPKNAWGIEDKYLFDEVSKQWNSDRQADTFNFILTGSNHSPLTVKLPASELERARAALPESLRKDEEWVRRIAHFRYADAEIAKFIERTRAADPDSLFVVTGDHSRRWHVSGAAPDYERNSVPIVLHGSGISDKTLPPGASGGHIDITATLMELIAPEGFVYYALGEKIAPGNVAVGPDNWIKNDVYGFLGNEKTVVLGNQDQKVTAFDAAAARARANEKREIARWRVLKGNCLERCSAQTQ